MKTQCSSSSRPARPMRRPWPRASTKPARARWNGWIEQQPPPRPARPALHRNDLLAVQQLLDVGGRRADLRHRAPELLFTAAELLAPPVDFPRISEVDQAAIGWYGFEHIGHGAVSLLVLVAAGDDWTPFAPHSLTAGSETSCNPRPTIAIVVIAMECCGAGQIRRALG